MSCHPRILEWTPLLQTHLPHLNKPQLKVLAVGSLVQNQTTCCDKGCYGKILGMKTSLFVRPLSDTEREIVCSGLRSSVAFTLRRSQILRASADGQTTRQMARQLGCDDQIVRNGIRALATEGVACLMPKSSRPKRTHAALEASQREPLRDRLHQSPRGFGKARSTWTLDLLADVGVEQGRTQRRLSDQTIRQALRRFQIHWQRANHWSTSPDPAYGRKNRSVIASVGSPSSTRKGS